MEAFVAPAAVVEALNDAKKPKKRQTYTAEEIKLVVDHARHVGTPTTSRKKWGSKQFSVPEPTVRKWLNHWQSTH